MTTLTDVRQRHLYLMQTTCQILGHLLQDVSQELATTARDGDDGWTVLEVVCHLRDYDDIFYRRARMMLTQDQPDLPGYDHDALAIERNYNDQVLTEVFATLQQSRRRFVEFFAGLSDADWERTGIHPERGLFSLTDAAMQVGLHDTNHLEQITRIIAES